jgi:hypothetical protein
MLHADRLHSLLGGLVAMLSVGPDNLPKVVDGTLSSKPNWPAKSTYLLLRPADTSLKPVTFPPGHARVSTRTLRGASRLQKRQGREPSKLLRRRDFLPIPLSDIDWSGASLGLSAP